MTSCEKAAILCSKTQYREATLLEKIKLNFHLFMCKTCSQHSKENTKLTSICEKANLHSLSEQEKKEMKKELQDQV